MTLEKVRADISRTDTEIIRLIAHRQELAEEIIRIKIRKGLPVHDGDRTPGYWRRCSTRPWSAGSTRYAVQEIFRILIAMSEERQREFSGDGNLP